MLGMGMGMYLRQDLHLEQELRLEQRMELRQELRQACILAPRLLHTLQSEQDSKSGKQVAYLKKLLAKERAGTGGSVQSIKYNAHRAKPIATTLLKLVNMAEENFLLPTLEWAIESPNHGYEPESFLNELTETLLVFPKNERQKGFQAITNLGEDRIHLGVQVLSSMLPNLENQEALLVLLSMIREETHLDVVHKLVAEYDEIVPKYKLSAQDTSLLYTMVAEAERLVVYQEYLAGNRLEIIRTFLEKEIRFEIQSSFPKVSPLIIATFENLIKNQDTFQKFCVFVSDDYVKRSVDNERAVMNGFMALTTSRNYKAETEAIFARIVEVCGSGRELIAVLRNLRYFAETAVGPFPYHITSGEVLATELQNHGIGSALAELELEPEITNLLIQEIGRMDRRNLFSILVKLFSVYKSEKYTHGMELIRLMLKRLLEKEYKGFRYNHEKAEDQLQVLVSSEAWEHNLYRVKNVGDVNGIEPAVQAILQIVPVLEQKFRTTFPQPGWWDILTLDNVFQEALRAVKESQDKTEKKSAIAYKQKAEAAYLILTHINELSRTDVDSFLELTPLIAKALNRTVEYRELRNLFREVESIFRSTAETRRKIERINLNETDDAYDLVNVGVTPVQTCQRWTEATTYNKALLAYVLDGNKKLIQIKTQDGIIIGRVIIRLLPFPINDENEVPMILIERPYTTRWTEDIGCALLEFLVEKAMQIAKDNDGVCGIAFSERDAGNDLWHILQKRLQNTKKQVHHHAGSVNFPDSLNAWEYSDAFGGLIKSGSTIDDVLNVLLIKSSNQ